jgi:hypothetical protein
LFTLGKFIGKDTPPQEFLIITKTGRIFCKFNIGSQEWIKNSTAPQLFSPCVTGILDTATNKIFDISGLALIHLKAKRFNLSPNLNRGKPSIFEKEARNIPLNDSNKICVLGNDMPALFFHGLVQLKNYGTRTEKQEELLSDWIYRYSVF